MTTQEIFDKVLKHAREQDCRSATLRGMPRFRVTIGDRTLKSFIGCLISDDEYYPELEGCEYDCNRLVVALEASGIPRSELRFISRLEEVHDPGYLDDWEHELEWIAKMHNLNFTPKSQEG